ncbi:hypothetical protein GQ457_02G032700 [Hibiscus cannabinus]
MRVELEIMRHEKIYMEASLTAAGSALQEKKRVVSLYKSMSKLADDLLDVVIEDSNGRELDEETIKELEEAIRDFNEALNQAQSPRDGGDDCCSDDDRNLDGTNGNGAGGSGSQRRGYTAAIMKSISGQRIATALWAH